MAEILLLGHDRRRAQSIRSILREEGHEVHLHGSVEAWAELDRQLRPELVVAPVDSIDGVLTTADPAPRGFPAPILWVAREGASGDLFLEHRLVDQVASPFMVEELLGRVDALIRVRRVIHRKPVPPLGAGAHQAPGRRHSSRGRRGLAARMTTLLGSPDDVRETPPGPYLEVEARLAEWADRRDGFEPGHADRVASLCAMIGEGLALEADEISLLLAAASRHDIGKVALPAGLLRQRTPLQEHQARWIRSHPRRGADLLRALHPRVEVADTILYHHECPDGSGYYGKWQDVPRTARALAVADVYDAMLSSRIKRQLSHEETLRELDESKGRTLDSDCVEALLSRLKRRATIIPLST